MNGVSLCLAVCFETILIENLADDITPYPTHVQCKFSISSIALHASVATRHTSPRFIIPHMTLVSLSHYRPQTCPYLWAGCCLLLHINSHKGNNRLV